MASPSPALDPSLARKYPRDFSRIPQGTDLGESETDIALNRAAAERRLDALEAELFATLKHAVQTRERPILTSALMPGGNVILDALHRNNLLQRVPVILVDTFHLFDETLLHLRELERHYGFEAKVYRAKDFANADEFRKEHGLDLVDRDVDLYDMLCKVEPMNRALQEHDSDCWINGRRRDHGAERARLAVWEDKKVSRLFANQFAHKHACTYCTCRYTSCMHACKCISYSCSHVHTNAYSNSA